MKANKNESVKVAIRVRPLNKRQTELNSPICTETNDNAIDIKKNKEAKEFIFDYVFGLESRQHQVYESCGYSIVENALEGFNGTVFAYGQTGAGKTFTMVGDYKDPEWKGIIPRGFDHVITAIHTSENRKYVVRASFIEIYNEDIYDLLDKKGDVKKDLKESKDRGVFIKDLKTVPVKSVDEMFQLLDFGNGNRSVAKTNMNATSSRSHALFSVHIESLEGDKVKASKLNFVDLAGSERQGKTGATGDTLKEGAKINLSLTALGNVINALVDGKKGGHIPYRDSKLTRLLQDSLGGNTKTLMIASVSPAEDNYDETVSTLRYAARARNIKNTPKINEDPKDALIREYLQEIETLKKQLSTGSAKSIGSEGYIQNQTSQELNAQLERAREREKELTEKEAQILAMKVKMKEMEELMLHREKESPELEQMAKKRRLEKKKIMKNQEINANKLLQREQQEQKDVQQDSPIEDGKDIAYWRSLAKRLRKKLKQANQDKQDISTEFQDERQRLNNCIRVVQNDLSFYRQVAEKFMSESDLAALKQSSTLDFEKREYTIPPFLMRDEKLSLPKTLRRHEVEDLWEEKRKGFKLQVLARQQSKEDKQFEKNLSALSSNQSGVLSELPESKSTFMGKVRAGQELEPMLKNRRILKIDHNSDKYKEKNYNTNDGRETFFRRTNFMMRDRSESEKKRPPSAFRVSSKTKLEALPARQKKEEPQGGPRSVSKGKEKLEPIKR